MKPSTQPHPDTVNWQVVKPFSTGVTSDYCLHSDTWPSHTRQAQVYTTLTSSISSMLKINKTETFTHVTETYVSHIK